MHLAYHVKQEGLALECQTLKLCHMVRLNNCLLVHDFIQNTLPKCFEHYFELLKLKYTTIITRNSKLSGLFVPSVNKTSTGIQSITFRSIQGWNNVCKTLAKTISQLLPNNRYLDFDLSKLSRLELKKIITGMCLSELNR